MSGSTDLIQQFQKQESNTSQFQMQSPSLDAPSLGAPAFSVITSHNASTASNTSQLPDPMSLASWTSNSSSSNATTALASRGGKKKPNSSSSASSDSTAPEHDQPPPPNYQDPPDINPYSPSKGFYSSGPLFDNTTPPTIKIQITQNIPNNPWWAYQWTYTSQGLNTAQVDTITKELEAHMPWQNALQDQGVKFTCTSATSILINEPKNLNQFKDWFPKQYDAFMYMVTMSIATNVNQQSQRIFQQGLAAWKSMANN